MLQVRYCSISSVLLINTEVFGSQSLVFIVKRNKQACDCLRAFLPISPSGTAAFFSELLFLVVFRTEQTSFHGADVAGACSGAVLEVFGWVVICACGLAFTEGDFSALWACVMHMRYLAGLSATFYRISHLAHSRHELWQEKLCTWLSF